MLERGSESLLAFTKSSISVVYVNIIPGSDPNTKITTMALFPLSRRGCAFRSILLVSFRRWNQQLPWKSLQNRMQINLEDLHGLNVKALLQNLMLVLKGKFDYSKFHTLTCFKV